MGEVGRPGSFTISGDRITLLEALSMAGDLTIYGRRDRVGVIRENNGKRTILFHDLRSVDILILPVITCNRTILFMWNRIKRNRVRAALTRIIRSESGFLLSPC